MTNLIFCHGIHICPGSGSGSRSDFYYTNPDPQIRIRITGNIKQKSRSGSVSGYRSNMEKISNKTEKMQENW